MTDIAMRAADIDRQDPHYRDCDVASVTVWWGGTGIKLQNVGIMFESTGRDDQTEVYYPRGPKMIFESLYRYVARGEWCEVEIVYQDGEARRYKCRLVDSGEAEVKEAGK